MDAIFDWVEIPAGYVQMGTTILNLPVVVRSHADLAIPSDYFLKEVPSRSVYVGAFDMSRVPVTRGEWNLVAEKIGMQLAPSDNSDFPVDGVAWGDAVAYCEVISDQIGQILELPTEAQWERAARGDDQREYPWGDDWDRRAANTAELGLGSPLPVGTLLRGASPFGVLDLAGNVDEWTRDEYAPYPNAPESVPKTESWARDNHVTRGGGFSHHRDLARCARRHGIYDGFTGAGFRLGRVAKPVSGVGG